MPARFSVLLKRSRGLFRRAGVATRRKRAHADIVRDDDAGGQRMCWIMCVHLFLASGEKYLNVVKYA